MTATIPVVGSVNVDLVVRVPSLPGRGVDVGGLGTASSPTGVALIVVDRAGESAIAVASGANHDLT
ncbi:MAG: hypothetical protein ACE14W_02790 [Candidatus Velamenicoccus archaeovorus]